MATTYAYTARRYDFRLPLPRLDDNASGFGASYATSESGCVAGKAYDFVSVRGRAIFDAGYSFDSARDESVATASLRRVSTGSSISCSEKRNAAAAIRFDMLQDISACTPASDRRLHKQRPKPARDGSIRRLRHNHLARRCPAEDSSMAKASATPSVGKNLCSLTLETTTDSSNAGARDRQLHQHSSNFAIVCGSSSCDNRYGGHDLTFSRRRCKSALYGSFPVTPNGRPKRGVWDTGFI